MSIIDELTACIDTAPWCYEDGIGSRRILHIPAEELTAIAKRIRKMHNDAVNKAHADGERNAIKQVRSRSEDYRKGYAAGAEAEKEITGKLLRALENDYGLHAEWDGLRRFWTTERSSMENIDGGTKAEHIEGSSRHEQGSSITDELREYMLGWDERNRVRRDLTAIADCIDERVAKMYADLTIGMEPMDEEHMAKDGWVKLPVDSDGVPIHVGDEVEVGSWPATPCIVRGISLGGTPWVLRIVQRDHEGEEGYGEVHLPWPDNRAGETVRHIRHDSWERIIEDAMGAFLSDDSPAEPTMEELVERCRKLAGE